MRLLIVEDKDSFRRLLVQALVGTSWDVHAVPDPEAAWEALQGGAFEVMVTDLRLPGFSGIELLKRAKRAQPDLRVLLMSAFGEPKDIVEAVRWGADDFLPKPFDLEVFVRALERLAALSAAPPPDPREPWVAVSSTMAELENGLRRASESSAGTLFCGESGVGKARCARRLHALRSPHAPFLLLRADALPPEGVSDRHLQMLRGGSILLVDLDNLPETRVPALTRALKSPLGQDLLWLGTCHAPERIPAEISLRVGTLAFTVPPLRRRQEDIIPLFRALLAARARQLGRTVPVVERGAERSLLTRPWRGNVRELAWCLDQALLATQGPVLAPLPEAEPEGGRRLSLPWPEGGTLDRKLEEVRHHAEGALLRAALTETTGSLVELAGQLGLSARTLALRLRDHAIPLNDAD